MFNNSIDHRDSHWVGPWSGIVTGEVGIPWSLEHKAVSGNLCVWVSHRN